MYCCSEVVALSLYMYFKYDPPSKKIIHLNVFFKVCKFDMSINHNPGLAVSVVPTLTEILTEFGDCCGPGGGGEGVEELAGGWTEEPIALVQVHLFNKNVLH